MTVISANSEQQERGRGADKKSKVIVSVQLTPDNNPVFAAMNVVPHVDGDNIKKLQKIMSRKVLRSGRTDGLHTTLSKNKDFITKRSLSVILKKHQNYYRGFTQ